MGHTSSADIAAWIVMLAEHESRPVTQIDLQKLVAFSASEYAARTGKRLFDDDVVAYKFGPVTKKVREQYGQYEEKPIHIPAERPRELSADQFEAISKVWSIFSPIGPSKMIQISHEDGPWGKYYREHEAIPIPWDELGKAWDIYRLAAESVLDHTEKNCEYDQTSALYSPAVPLGEYDDIINRALRDDNPLSSL